MDIGIHFMIHYSQIIIEHRVDWQLSARVTRRDG